MALITVPKILREKLSEEGVDALVDVINKSDGKQKEDVIKIVEEKFERRLAGMEGMRSPIRRLLSSEKDSP